jgi:hypothetical protein
MWHEGSGPGADKTAKLYDEPRTVTKEVTIARRAARLD